MTVRRTELGNTGQQTSILGCGTMWFANMSQAETDTALNYCLDRGITYFDCARSYGDAEIKVGRAIKHRRDEFVIATKAAGRDGKTAYQQITESQQRLDMDVIDLIQLHYVNHQDDFDRIVAPNGALSAALRARDEGIVRHIGISGHRPEKLAEWLGTGHFATVLFHLSPVQPFAATDLLPIARTLGIGSLAMRPIGSGLLSDFESALRYVRGYHPDVIVSGLTTPEIVDKNIAALNHDVEAKEFSKLEAQVLEMGNNGCRRCNYCDCPVNIEIPDTLLGEHAWRNGLMSTQGHQDWTEATRFAHKCANYAPCIKTPLCESPCPYDLPIREIVMRVAANAEHTPAQDNH